MAPFDAGIFDRSHALVTGGSRGIGLAIAAVLVEHGARVTLLGRDKLRLATAAATLGHQTSFVVADVADRESVVAAMENARALNGPVEFLINSAGQAATALLSKTDTALWDRMIDVNLRGTLNCIQLALPDMLARNSGRIVNIASTAGLVGYEYCAAYCAAKHGVIGLTRALALELARSGITVNAICPGFTDTNLVKEAVANIQEKTGRDPEQVLASLVSHNPQRRLIAPAEVAHAALWLCSPGSESITGQSIAIAGGEVT